MRPTFRRILVCDDPDVKFVNIDIRQYSDQVGIRFLPEASAALPIPIPCLSAATCAGWLSLLKTKLLEVDVRPRDTARAQSARFRSGPIRS